MGRRALGQVPKGERAFLFSPSIFGHLPPSCLHAPFSCLFAQGAVKGRDGLFGLGGNLGGGISFVKAWKGHFWGRRGKSPFPIFSDVGMRLARTLNLREQRHFFLSLSLFRLTNSRQRRVDEWSLFLCPCLLFLCFSWSFGVPCCCRIAEGKQSVGEKVEVRH